MAPRVLPDDRLVCTNPFEWFEIHPAGDVFLCCPAWLKVPVGNLLEEPASAIWNGPVARQLRRSVLDGSFGRCNRKRCPRLHAAVPPVRQVGSLPEGDVRAAIRSRAEALPYGPKRLNLCFDRSCNLACPSCRSGHLIASGEEAERVGLLTRRVVEAGEEVETLVLSGYGDPFGSPFSRSLLQSFRREAFPRLQNIDLHTNGQLWDETMWRTMPAVHPYVRSAEISVDAATSGTYAVNRRGGDFDRLLRNLDFLATLPVALKLSFVVQRNNCREMEAFVELGHRYACSVYFSQLVNWGTFSREEFRLRAVHLPEHPERPEFLACLRRVAALEKVDPGNLLPLLSGAP